MATCDAFGANGGFVAAGDVLNALSGATVGVGGAVVAAAVVAADASGGGAAAAAAAAAGGAVDAIAGVAGS
jgi:hypothetical protein